MYVTIRLYRQHDMDLISLYKVKEFKFQRKMKQVLIAYSKNEECAIDVSSFRVEPGYVKYITEMHIRLDEKTDAAAIKILSEIKPGLRNSFLKALFRSHLVKIPLTSYENKEDGIVFLKRSETAHFKPSKNAVKVKKEVAEKIKKVEQDEKNRTNANKGRVVSNFDLEKERQSNPRVIPEPTAPPTPSNDSFSLDDMAAMFEDILDS